MDEIDIKDVIDIIKRYKISIVFITLFFTLTVALYAHFKPNFYQADATIEIKSNDSKNKTDLVSMAIGTGVDIDSVSQIIESRYIGILALKNLDIGIHYFTQINYKTVELYKNSPFTVEVKKIAKNTYNKSFQIIPVTDNSFRFVEAISLKKTMINKIKSYIPIFSKGSEQFRYSKEYKYEEQIDTSMFSIVVHKKYKLTNTKYTFTIPSVEKNLQYIKNNLTVAPLSKNIVTLVFKDNVPLRAKEVLNALLNVYINETWKEKHESARKKLHFIDKQLAIIRKQLQKSSVKLQKFKSSNVITSIREKGKITSVKISRLETKLYDINMQLNILKNIFQYVKKHKDIRGINVDASQKTSPSINALIIRLRETGEKRISLLTNFTPLHPDVIKITNDLYTIRSSLQKALKSTITGLQSSKISLQRVIKKEIKKLKELPEQESKLAKFNRNFVVNEKIYSYLLEKRAETAIVEASRMPVVRVVDAPIEPTAPVSHRPTLIIIMGFIVGLIIGVTFAFVRNSFNDSIKTREELERYTNIPLYGVIPYLNGRKNIESFHEAARIIRTNLEFLQDRNKHKIVTVASFIPKEGKTIITTELGMIIAKSGKRVIVVDLDMRQSRIDKMFTLSNKNGLSTLLNRKNKIEEVTQKSLIDNLYVITSGPTPPNPSELLMSKVFEELVERLKIEYDYILFDTPSLGFVADAMMTMRISDINLIVIHSEYSKKEYMNDINKFIDEYGLKAGIVLNAVRMTESEAAYGYGYGVQYGCRNDYYK